ncbi:MULTISPECIES: hypothetical protein [Marinobacter]|uniref:Uncharacterized protein n=1 Tax=Marinobacter shengliensis TaxID=1389223 RepID=A0ABV4W3M4_9GAMM|nr:hypothetical protein [Marinobacter sp. LQ44]AMQ89740.1 hypothetical protein ASQ50_14105 [Marinobacter sp. LQ44]
MAFRADEAARIGYEQVEAYLVPRPRDSDESVRMRSREALMDIVDELGPVVDTYPTWHPLVCNHDSRIPETTPSAQCGYNGLDHTRLFRNGFITCPYTASGKAEKVIESVNALPPHPVANITAEKLDVKLYMPDATPVLVKCEWNRALNMDGTIPLSIAMPLILEQELPCWRWSELAETWESMRYYLLGSPHGARSSLFVNQETGQAIKKIWNSLIYTGMFGPIKV